MKTDVSGASTELKPGPQWLLLLKRTLFRQRLLTISRQAFWGMLVLGAVYAAVILGTRLTGLARLGAQPFVLLALPFVAAVAALLLPGKPTLHDAARAVDRQAATADLFLTMLMLEASAGEFQPLVAANAESRASKLRANEVVPIGFDRRLAAIGAALLTVVMLVHLVPQLDPFGKVDAAQQVEKELRKLDETKRATKERLAQIERENSTDAEAKEVKQALDQLKTTMKASDPKARQANSQSLAGAQKNIADQWRKISSEKLKQLMSQSASSQLFGSSAAAAGKKWLEQLQAGSTESLKKEMAELQRDMEELVKSKDPVRNAQLAKRIRERLDALSEFANDQVGSKPLAAALKRAQEQMHTAMKGDADPAAAKEAMQAASESMKLADKELEQVAQSAKDLKDLEQALAVLQKAKQLNNSEGLDGKKLEGCQSLDDYEKMFASISKGEYADEGMEGDGGERPEEKADSHFKTEMSKSHITKGKVLLTLKTKGQGEHVDVKEQYRSTVRQMKQGISEAILQEEIPPGYHQGIKSYFDSLDETPK